MQTNEENTADTAPIPSVRIANDTATQVSGLSSTGLASPNVNTARINIGQHPTPESVNFVVNESAYDDGYDSEGQLGPFFDAVHGEEGDVFLRNVLELLKYQKMLQQLAQWIVLLTALKMDKLLKKFRKENSQWVMQILKDC